MMIRNIVKKIIGRGIVNHEMPKEDAQVELERIKSDMSVFVNKIIEEKIASYTNDIKKGKALIDQIESFPDGTWLVRSEEDPDNKVEDQIKYERYDGWLKESLLKFVKGQYSGNQRRLRELKKKHKESMGDAIVPSK